MSITELTVDVRLGVTIITAPDGQRLRVMHDDPQKVNIRVDNLTGSATDHPEAEVPDKPWMPLEKAIPYWQGKPKPESGIETWKNDLYTVQKTRIRWPGEDAAGNPAPYVVHLSIRRNDRHWARDWRHFQRIKNELVGPECEGVELYPAESRLVDTSNQFHLWVLDEPGARWPVGWEDGRIVFSEDLVGIGARQRPHPEETDETVTPEMAYQMVKAYADQHGLELPDAPADPAHQES